MEIIVMFFKTPKKLRERGEKLMDELAKEMQKASAKFVEIIILWESTQCKGEPYPEKRINEVETEIIQHERTCDDIKNELITQIFSKGAFLPILTSDYYKLVRAVDHVVNRTEVAMRRLAARKEFPERIPHEFPLLANLLREVTDSLQDALKFLKEDLKKAKENADRIEEIREDARELDFIMFGRFITPDYSAKDAFFFEKVSVSIIGIIRQAEIASDFIRTMAVKYI